MELITKENLRLSGFYGKQIISGVNAPIKSNTDKEIHFADSQAHLHYYKTNKKIYITGKNSEDLYHDIIFKVDVYLHKLCEINDIALQRILLSNLANETSLNSMYHIFNMEILKTICLKKRKRIDYAIKVATTFRFLDLENYEEIMFFILFCEDDDLVERIINTIEHSSFQDLEYLNIKKIIDDSISQIEKNKIEENLRKIKI